MQAAREAARRAQCVNNLKQLGLAVHNYLSQTNAFPPGAENYSSVGYWQAWPMGWAAVMLPGMEQVPMYNALNFIYGGWDNQNTTVTKSQVPTLVCPSEDKGSPSWPGTKLNYVANMGGPAAIQTFTGVLVALKNDNSGNSGCCNTPRKATIRAQRSGASGRKVSPTACLTPPCSVNGWLPGELERQQSGFPRHQTRSEIHVQYEL